MNKQKDMTEIEDKKAWRKAVRMAMDTEFLEGDEYPMYATAVYNAIMWGKKVK